MGDVNMDGVIDCRDAYLVVNVYVGLAPPLTSEQEILTDVYLNGIVDMTDASLILRMAEGMPHHGEWAVSATNSNTHTRKCSHCNVSESHQAGTGSNDCLLCAGLTGYSAGNIEISKFPDNIEAGLGIIVGYYYIREKRRFMMKKITLILMVVAIFVGGCNSAFIRKENINGGAIMIDDVLIDTVPEERNNEGLNLEEGKALSISDFTVFEIGSTTYEQVVEKLGNPSGSRGSGIVWFYYQLADGTYYMMFFGSGDGESRLTDIKIIDTKGRTFLLRQQ